MAFHPGNFYVFGGLCHPDFSDAKGTFPMSRIRYVVRVALMPEQATAQVVPLLNCFRYAGFLKTHPETRSLSFIFDMLPPAYISDTEDWCKAHAERMQTYGFNAVVAPQTEPPKDSTSVTHVPENAAHLDRMRAIQRLYEIEATYCTGNGPTESERQESASLLHVLAERNGIKNTPCDPRDSETLRT